ncbi:putative eukaryotic translation initiation factor 3 subunit 8 [Trypanosoma conorhini]|uniref:Putative eukaryotic translation initiation factor 3 subunit 8 n=1 Tax=Trypanosoma conorhini TaxID=83891 RepID=A0A3R7PVE1_9TRYP|nr:putative eukaryotic translation initiation factor 3 subunit 8 [Trypanosoma conorhini]RNF25755.1 putative eukaryotic translation initiation factor 3 subunit 8 [Trypanosoma conorhini]
MSNFFDVSDSDESLEEVIHQDEQVERQVAQIDPKWFEVTDDEDADERQVVLSRNEKSLNEIQTISDLFDFNVDHESWNEAEKAFVQLRQKATAHKEKFKTIPWPFLECLRNTPDLSEKMDEKETFKRPEDFHSLKRLIKALQELTETYKHDIERLHDEESEEDGGDEGQAEEEKELTEEDIAQELKQALVQKGKRAARCQKLAQECKKKGFTALRITALGIAADALLEEDTRLPYVATTTWTKSFTTVSRCYSLMTENPAVAVKEDFSGDLTSKRAIIVDGLCGLLQKLQIHLLRIAQFKTGATDEYFEIIKLENQLVDLTDTVLGYYQQRRRGKAICCQILIDILGSRRQQAHDILYHKMTRLTRNIVTSSVIETVRELYQELLVIGDEEAKCRALLNLAYQMGLEGNYQEGRDLVLRSGVEETVEKSVHLAILYNRVIAQLGLASFAAGDVIQAYNLLSPLWSNRNHDVLISQRMPDYVKESEEKELKYRDLLVPSHAYIQHAQLELATMLSTLVVDTPKEAKKPYEGSRHQSYFYRIINQMAYQPLLGEPVEFREQLTAAYIELKLGDYAKASEIIKNMTAWSKMPNGEEAFNKFLQHLKEAALRIFCYNHRCNFAAISVDMMMKKYELTENEVKCVINDIISESNSSLIAFWDREDKYLHVDRSNTSRLQYLVEGIAESVVEVAQYSERRVRDSDFRGGRGRGRGRGRGYGRGRGNR